MSSLEMPTESELRRIIGPTSPTLRVSSYLRSGKYWLERLAAGVMLLVCSPIILFLMVCIYVDSPAWPLFSQIRVGKDGKYFRIHKLRSMRPDAEKGGAQFSTKNDPRVTTLGKFLRKSHLDELPQLYNVFAGHMSFVGPRPERPEFVAILSRVIDHYPDRLTVLPGVTGLAAINLPPDDGPDSARKKQVLDVEYIESASLLMDIRMVMATSLRLLCVKGDTAMRWMKLNRLVVLDEKDTLGLEATTPDAMQKALQATAENKHDVEERFCDDASVLDEYEDSDSSLDDSAIGLMS